MTIEPADVVTLTLLLSPERLKKLTQLTGSAKIAIDLHQETLDLGASLMAVTATIEIALRNAVCENLNEYFGVTNWLSQPPIQFQWRKPEQLNVTKALDSARRAEYAKLSQAQKGELEAKAYPNGRPPNTSHLKRALDRRKHIIVTEGKIVAELTLYFWKRLFSHEYEQTLWRTTLKRTFPDKSLARSAVADKLEDIYQTRNRLAHHEPVLYKRFESTMTAIEFVVQRLGMKSPASDTPLAKLVQEGIRTTNAKAAELHARLNSFRNIAI